MSRSEEISMAHAAVLRDIERLLQDTKLFEGLDNPADEAHHALWLKLAELGHRHGAWVLEPSASSQGEG